jgi:hypothetical protein
LIFMFNDALSKPPLITSNSVASIELLVNTGAYIKARYDHLGNGV